jgi:hypothetical protein
MVKPSGADWDLEAAQWSTITPIYEGTNQIQCMIMARRVVSMVGTSFRACGRPEMRRQGACTPWTRRT